MSYDRYEPVVRSVKDFENKVEDLVRKFKHLKTEWLQKGYDETSMQTVKKEVQGMIYEYDRLSNELDAFLGKADILTQEDLTKSNEQKQKLDKACFKLREKYDKFKDEVGMIWGKKDK
jgi:hypothetical protein